MKTNLKSLVVIRLFSGYDSLRKRLVALHARYRERRIFSEFNGIEFEIERFVGPGSRAKNKELYSLKDSFR